jgi:hypothetical protein
VRERNKFQERFQYEAVIKHGTLGMDPIRKDLPGDFFFHQRETAVQPSLCPGKFWEEESELGKPHGLDEQMVIGDVIFQSGFRPATASQEGAQNGTDGFIRERRQRCAKEENPTESVPSLGYFKRIIPRKRTWRI